jgi:hypothetical protein
MAPGRNCLNRTSYTGSVLLLEFFPLFVAMVGVVAAISLFVTDRRSRQDPPRTSSAPERPGRRPSMLP